MVNHRVTSVATADNGVIRMENQAIARATRVDRAVAGEIVDGGFDVVGVTI